jgi:selenophosphate synthase
MSADRPIPAALAELANVPLDEETKKKAKEEAGNSVIETTEFVVDVVNGIASGGAVHAVEGAASAVGGFFSAIADIFE